MLSPAPEELDFGHSVQSQLGQSSTTQTCKALQTSRKRACVTYRCDTWELPCFNPRLSINNPREFSSRDPGVVPGQMLTQPSQCVCCTLHTVQDCPSNTACPTGIPTPENRGGRATSPSQLLDSE